MAYDATGPSKLKASVIVPTTPPTLTCTTRITSYRLASASHTATARQLTELADVHADVSHTADTSCAVAVYSLSPKLSPLTVTEPRPLSTWFAMAYDATGPSKLNTLNPVPTTPPTVISAASSSPISGSISHTTEVPDVHDDVLHGADASAAVDVYVLLPNPSPLTVTDPSPVTGAFCSTPDTTAASNENTPARPGSYVSTLLPVPLSAPTVTSTYPA